MAEMALLAEEIFRATRSKIPGRGAFAAAGALALKCLVWCEVFGSAEALLSLLNGGLLPEKRKLGG